VRTTIKQQLPLPQPLVNHPHARELAAISDILDRMPEVLSQVRDDVVCGRRTNRGRDGMTAEQVVRVLVLKQMNGFSYQELSFQLASNHCYQQFCRFGAFASPPKRSTLQQNLKRLRAETLEKVNLAVIAQARSDGIERGDKARFDCTGVETNIHAPTDSTLLWDTVRVLDRLLRRAKEEFGICCSSHARVAKRRMVAIINAGTMKKRLPLYKDLIKVTNKTMAYAKDTAKKLKKKVFGDIKKAILADATSAELLHFVTLGQQVVSQSQRRVVDGESVPVDEKIVSIFEPHTDILVKGRRNVEYGHKICLGTGRSCLVLDCQITEGNPADSTLATKMVERHIDHYKSAPRQVVFDGGFASRENVNDIKELGVNDVAFSKRCGMAITDMVRSSWVYKRLRNFRAGVEGVISFLKRSFGVSRCSWRGLHSFKAYVWSSIVSCNLLVFARHRLATT